jgi:hypothetical protein
VCNIAADDAVFSIGDDAVCNIGVDAVCNIAADDAVFSIAVVTLFLCIWKL